MGTVINLSLERLKRKTYTISRIDLDAPYIASQLREKGLHPSQVSSPLCTFYGGFIWDISAPFERVPPKDA